MKLKTIKTILLMSTVSLTLVSCNKKSKKKHIAPLPAAASENPADADAAGESPSFKTNSNTIAGLSGAPVADPGLDKKTVIVTEVDESLIYAVLDFKNQDIVVTVPVVYAYKNDRKETVNGEMTLSSNRPTKNNRLGFAGSPGNDLYVMSDINFELRVTVTPEGVISVAGFVDGEPSFEKGLTLVNGIEAMSSVMAAQAQEDVKEAMRDLEDKTFSERWEDWTFVNDSAKRNTPVFSEETREKMVSQKKLWSKVAVAWSSYWDDYDKNKRVAKKIKSFDELRKKVEVSNSAASLKYSVIKSELENRLPQPSVQGESVSQDPISFYAAENEVIEIEN